MMTMPTRIVVAVAEDDNDDAAGNMTWPESPLLS